MRNGGSLQLCNLWVDLRGFHVRGIDLEVGAGEYFVVLGPTGAGKTVLLETIAGLFQPRRGCILLDGEEITNTPPEHRGFGFVYQDYALFPHLNVLENIAFGLRLDRLHRAAITERVEETSQMLGIDHLLERSPRTLSGGERQRAALARALVVEPRLLLLDEPLSALDPETREGLQRELARVHRELGTTTLHVTHDFQEAVALADRIAVVHGGQIVQVGTPATIFRRPASELVARFVGVRNIFRGKLRSGGGSHRLLTVDDLDIAVVTNLTGEVHASLRPEDIILSIEPLRSSARNCFRGYVTQIADRGPLIYITVSVPPDFTCVITRRSFEEMELRIDKEVYVAFKASAAHVF
ncbi:MAG: tungstate ABC transporter ATP-binding protein WtpC [Anaerolineae bacterium]